MPSAVVDLTEIVPTVTQRLDRSPLFQRWMASDFVWVTSLELLTEFKQVTDRPDLADFIVTADGDLHDAALVACLQDEWNIHVAYRGEFLNALAARS